MPKNFYILPDPQQIVSCVCRTLSLPYKPPIDLKGSVSSTIGFCLAMETFFSVKLGCDKFLDRILSWLRSGIFFCFVQAFRDVEFSREKRMI